MVEKKIITNGTKDSLQELDEICPDLKMSEIPLTSQQKNKTK